MADGGKLKLPLLREGSRNLVTGTYLAEQISSFSYDLVSAGASPSRSHIGRAGAISPSPGGSSPASPRDLIQRARKKASNKSVKCTELPALENIDTLFKERGDQAVDGVGDEAGDGLRLEKIDESPDVDDDDTEFKEWLTLPGIGETPRDETTTATWYLLISQKTLNTHSEHHVASSIMQVLHLDPQTAFHKAVELRKQRLVVLEELPDKTQAFRKLQKLRSFGLQAQVTIASGLPGRGQLLEHSGRRRKSVGGRHNSKQNHNRSYTELFFKAGAERSTGRYVSAGSHVSKKRAGLAQWRSVQGGDFEQDIVAEDAVEALFSTEKKQEADSGSRLFRSILADHHTEIHVSPRTSSAVDSSKLAKMVKDSSEHKRKGTSKLKPSLSETILSAVKAVHPAGENKDPMSPSGDATTGASIHEASKPKEATKDRKEACLLMRFFMFGQFGNEDSNDKSPDPLFRENFGTKEQVKILHRMWSKLDNDSSGRVDFAEFKHFVEDQINELVKKCPQPMEPQEPATKSDARQAARKVHTRRSLYHHAMTVHMQLNSVADLTAQAVEDAQKFSAALCEKLSVGLLGKKSSFTVEDMMRLIWISATAADTKAMKNWCREFVDEAIRDRVETPPTLETMEYEGLCSVFEHFDDERRGQILFDTLVTKGLIYAEQVGEYRFLWDEDGNGELSLSEFCDMMCPVGFRATNASEIGSRPDGTRVLFDPSIGCWKVERVPGESEPGEIPKELGGSLQEAQADDSLQ